MSDPKNLIRLPHTGLQVPHTRYHLANFQQMEMTCGIAYNASVYEGERIVGVIENKGNGGGTWFNPATYEDNRAVHEFVTACRVDDQTLYDGEALDHLITEHETAQEIAKCARRRHTLIRGAYADGLPAVSVTFGTPPLWLQHPDSPVRSRVMGELKASDPDVTMWEFWTGNAWTPLTLPADTE
ncbi:hypothetical protein [Streptomyces microflavus]|uniref:hypothetical protein n=1 Tax=Streptomyces microflavus TaxID=1919 RepID=UPI003648FFEF